jgi:hypothetical protein
VEAGVSDVWNRVSYGWTELVEPLACWKGRFCRNDINIVWNVIFF